MELATTLNDMVLLLLYERRDHTSSIELAVLHYIVWYCSIYLVLVASSSFVNFLKLFKLVILRKLVLFLICYPSISYVPSNLNSCSKSEMELGVLAIICQIMIICIFLVSVASSSFFYFFYIFLTKSKIDLVMLDVTVWYESISSLFPFPPVPA